MTVYQEKAQMAQGVLKALGRFFLVTIMVIGTGRHTWTRHK